MAAGRGAGLRRADGQPILTRRGASVQDKLRRVNGESTAVLPEPPRTDDSRRLPQVHNPPFTTRADQKLNPTPRSTFRVPITMVGLPKNGDVMVPLKPA